MQRAGVSGWSTKSWRFQATHGAVPELETGAICSPACILHRSVSCLDLFHGKIQNKPMFSSSKVQICLVTGPHPMPVRGAIAGKSAASIQSRDILLSFPVTHRSRAARIICYHRIEKMTSIK
jgi:hypothetical protein